jgi:predicted secreted protein
MAQPDIIRGTYFAMGVGDGASPETFPALCGITTRKFTQQANTNDRFTRDCTDPEDIPHRRLIVTGKQWSLSCDGDLDRSNLATMQGAFGVTKNWRFWYTEPAADLVYQGYWEGPAILTQIEETGGDDAFATISVQIESDGEWTWTEV